MIWANWAVKCVADAPQSPKNFSPRFQLDAKVSNKVWQVKVWVPATTFSRTIKMNEWMNEWIVYFLFSKILLWWEITWWQFKCNLHVLTIICKHDYMKLTGRERHFWGLGRSPNNLLTADLSNDLGERSQLKKDTRPGTYLFTQVTECF